LLHGISPEDFTVFLSFDFVTMIVLGGLGTVEGGLLGAFLLTLLQNTLTRLPVVSEFKNLYTVVLGAVLILTIVFFPQGLAGGWRSLRRRWSSRSSGSRPRASPAHAAGNVAGGEGRSSSERAEAKY
jgi:branched-chain amino acid transport system permease protein